MIQTFEWVKTWKRSKIDAFVNVKVLIELLVLAVFRILDRGWFSMLHTLDHYSRQGFQGCIGSVDVTHID